MPDDINANVICAKCGEGILFPAELPPFHKRVIGAAALGVAFFASICLLDLLQGTATNLPQLAAIAIGFSLVNYTFESSPYKCSVCGISSHLVWWGRRKRLQIRRMFGHWLLAVIVVEVLARVWF